MIVQRDAFIVDLDLLALIQIVVDDHLVARTDQSASQFHRCKPVGVDMGDLAAFEEECQVSDILRSSGTWLSPVADTAQGRKGST